MSGNVWEGPYVGGKRNGHWVWRDKDGSTTTFTWVNGVPQP